MAIVLNGTTGISSPGGDVSVSQSLSGNLVFTGTGNRITGDFSNATVANRIAFQTSTVDGSTNVGILPNGTGVSALLTAFSSSSDPANASTAQFGLFGTTARITSGITGTGTYLPMTFYTSGSEAMRITTSQNVGIGINAPTSKLHVAGGRTDLSANNETFALGVRYASGTGIYYIGATNSATPDLVFSQVGGTEKMRLTNDGNLGLGTTNAAPANGKGMSINGGSITRIDLRTSTSGDASGDGTSLQLNGNDFTIENRESGYVAFATSLQERARITSDGNLLVGCTALPNGTSQYGAAFSADTSNRRALYLASSTTSTVNLAVFFNPNGSVGLISTSGTSTTFATSSDYRLKENVQPMQNALATVAQLKPVTYNWKVDGSAGQGFIAHELQAVVPDAVTGEKDAVDENGKPKYQGVDTSFLVATLTAAIQELTARLEVLENK